MTLVEVAALTLSISLVAMVICTSVVIRQQRIHSARNHRLLEKLETKLSLLDQIASIRDLRAVASVDDTVGRDGVVASDLADSIQRADASEGPPGTAADAALTTEKHRNGRS